MRQAVSPDSVEHGDEREQRGHQQHHAARHNLRDHAEAAPGYDDEERRWKVALEEVAPELPGQLYLQSGLGVLT